MLHARQSAHLAIEAPVTWTHLDGPRQAWDVWQASNHSMMKTVGAYSILRSRLIRAGSYGAILAALL